MIKGKVCRDFESFVRDTKEVIDFTVNGECSSCGSCCGRLLPVTAKELRVIDNYIRVHKITPNKGNLMVMGAIDMSCPFRDDINRVCMIYEVRPRICREFKCNIPKGVDPSRRLLSMEIDVVDMRKRYGAER